MPHQESMTVASKSTADGAVLAPVAGRVILADDNADMREYVGRLLAARYEVVAVADGEAALAEARSRPPDLVLADVMMPRLDGLQLLAALRSDVRTGEIPVILSSARAGEEASVEGMQAGADDYLVKPFAARELLARVSAHLALAHVRAEAAERERSARAEADAARQHLHDLFMQAPRSCTDTPRLKRWGASAMTCCGLAIRSAPTKNLSWCWNARASGRESSST
jgi:PleD family two-component response regulator